MRKPISKNPAPSVFSLPSSSSKHLSISVLLNGQLSAQALIDSGASDSFIDSSFALQNGLKLTKKSVPVSVQVIDGRPISSGLITHEVKLRLSINNHYEDISLHATKLGQYPLVLGFSWLQKHLPSINWSVPSLHFSSEFCRESCAVKLTSPDLPTSTVLISLVGSTVFSSLANQHTLYAISVHKIPGTTTQLPSTLSALAANEALSSVPKIYHEFKRIFSSQEANELPPHRSYDHSIPLLEGKSPPFGPIYSLSEKELKVLYNYIQDNLANRFITPSLSSAGAPILFVKKADGSLRLCVDYRGLNNITVKNRYPLPLISELLHRLRSAKVFTKLDLRGAYNLLRIAKGEEWKTAFRTRYGLYEYKVMPFGLTNAPASFQHLMNDIFADMLDKFVVVYLDDILIYSDTQSEHEQHVKTVLRRLDKNNLFVKPEKCEFHLRSTEFLGFHIASSGISMSDSKVKAIMDWPNLKS